MKGPVYRLKRRKAQRQEQASHMRVMKNLDDQVRESVKYPDFLVVGEEIWIGCKQHAVQSGETLDDIARLYTTTIEYVCYSNGIHFVRPLTIIEWP